MAKNSVTKVTKFYDAVYFMAKIQYFVFILSIQHNWYVARHCSMYSFIVFCRDFPLKGQPPLEKKTKQLSISGMQYIRTVEPLIRDPLR